MFCISYVIESTMPYCITPLLIVLVCGKTSEYVQDIILQVCLVYDSSLITDLFDVVTFEKPRRSLCSNFKDMFIEPGAH